MRLPGRISQRSAATRYFKCMINEAYPTENSIISIGAEAPELLLTLLRVNEQIESFGLTIYTPEPGIEERMKDSSIQSASGTMQEFLHHDEKQNETWTVIVKDLTAEWL